MENKKQDGKRFLGSKFTPRSCSSRKPAKPTCAPAEPWNLLAHRHVPNKDKVFEAAVFLYKTRGEDSERAELAANLFRKSLGTNAPIADVKLDNDTLHIKLERVNGEFVAHTGARAHRLHGGGGANEITATPPLVRP